jgi:nucleoside-diphosphate-sugar epimerase
VPDGGPVEIWGDGQQTRSFVYIDDCIEGLLRFMHSDFAGPLNLGSEELVTIDGLYDLVADIAGKHIQKVHDTTRPQGVRGRNSDNRLIRRVLKWAPSISLAEGLRPTYEWIAKQVELCPSGVKSTAIRNGVELPSMDLPSQAMRP